MSIVWRKKEQTAFTIDLQVEDMSEMKTSISFSLQTLNILFCIGVQLINNVMIVSVKQQMDSVIYIHVPILPQTPLTSRLPYNIKQSSMCHTYHRSFF